MGRKIIATTENPDLSKPSLPEGRLCMVMGLGPKGLPGSFVNNSKYHFELTSKKIGLKLEQQWVQFQHIYIYYNIKYSFLFVFMSEKFLVFF